MNIDHLQNIRVCHLSVGERNPMYNVGSVSLCSLLTVHYLNLWSKTSSCTGGNKLIIGNTSFFSIFLPSFSNNLSKLTENLLYKLPDKHTQVLSVVYRLEPLEFWWLYALLVLHFWITCVKNISFHLYISSILIIIIVFYVYESWYRPFIWKLIL